MLRILAPLFFLSGASALVYQVLWMRLLALVFGVTVYAATAVLASFMAGLALGSWLGGRVAERATSPLRLFGLVEIGIGVLGFASQPLLASLTPVYMALQAWLPAAVLTQSLARFTGSFLVLVGVTTLMGMTLPLVLKAASGQPEKLGARIAILYGANTAGAVAGALLAGFYLIGSHGIAASFKWAALTNLLIGATAMLLSPRTATPAARIAPPAPPAAAPGLPRIAVTVFALSGFAALALEVVWFRILVYFVPATTYAFSTMLGAVLLGLAGGSFAATPLLVRRDRLLARLALLHLATAVSVPLAATLLVLAYRAGWHTTADVHVSVLIAFPPAFLMGMGYPMGLRGWAAAGHAQHGLDAQRVGNLNSANLIGGIAGAVAGAFVVLPWLGTRAGLCALASVYLMTCFLLLREFAPRLRAPIAAGALCAFAAAALSVPNLVDAATGRRYGAGERLFWWKEGAQTTAAVRITPAGRRLLYLDGLHQASDAREVVLTHRLIGHLPMALHPNPARAIVIGLGGGVTPGAVSQHATSVDLVELSSSVVGGAAWFSHVNFDVLHQPNVRLRIDDGRNFLMSRAGYYDVITADLIQPEHAGAGNLYSREYFRLVRRALAPGGLALQWIGRRPEHEYKLILRTFLEVFPETTLWADGHLLVGALGPLSIQRDAFERQLEHPPARQALEEIGLGSFEQLLNLYVTGPRELRAFAGPGPILTDDRPLVEYFKSLPRTGAPDIDLAPLRADVMRHVR
jgi:spermidine synthase